MFVKLICIFFMANSSERWRKIFFYPLIFVEAAPNFAATSLDSTIHNAFSWGKVTNGINQGSFHNQVIVVVHMASSHSLQIIQFI